MVPVNFEQVILKNVGDIADLNLKKIILLNFFFHVKAKISQNFQWSPMFLLVEKLHLDKRNNQNQTFFI